MSEIQILRRNMATYIKNCVVTSVQQPLFFLKGNNIAKEIGRCSLFWGQLKNKNRGDFCFAALFKSVLVFERNMHAEMGKGRTLPGQSLLSSMKTTFALGRFGVMGGSSPLFWGSIIAWWYKGLSSHLVPDRFAGMSRRGITGGVKLWLAQTTSKRSISWKTFHSLSARHVGLV